MLPIRHGLYKRHQAFPIASETTKSMICGSAAEDMVLVGVFLMPLRTCVLKYTDYQKQKLRRDLLSKQTSVDQPLFKLWIIFAWTSTLTSEQQLDNQKRFDSSLKKQVFIHGCPRPCFLPEQQCKDASCCTVLSSMKKLPLHTEKGGFQATGLNVQILTGEKLNRQHTKGSKTCHPWVFEQTGHECR